MNATEALEMAQRIVGEHPLGCSCGSPECPQLQASLMGVAYFPDEFIRDFVRDQTTPDEYPVGRDTILDARCPETYPRGRRVIRKAHGNAE